MKTRFSLVQSYFASIGCAPYVFIFALMLALGIGAAATTFSHFHEPHITTIR
jgi:hypothetical protein